MMLWFELIFNAMIFIMVWRYVFNE